jgi:hypothetical protein
MLAKLACRSALADTPALEPAAFGQAAAAMNAACAAWRQAANMWQVMTTDTQKATTPASAEVHDLMLRLGRVAHASPDWTLATEARTPWRTPSALAPDKAAFLNVLVAAHETADALSRMATGDLDAIGVLGNARRFYMPNTILWDDHAPTRQYAYAPHDRVALLHDVYQVVACTSRAAAEAIDTIAERTGARTSILAFARQALPAGPENSPDLVALKSRLTYFTRPRHIRIPDGTPLEPTSQLLKPDEQSRRETPREDEVVVARGPVEETIRAASVTDPGLLVQAAAIDRAASELVKRAVRLAAQDTADVPAPAQQPRPASRRSRDPSSSPRNRPRRAS